MNDKKPFRCFNVLSVEKSTNVVGIFMVEPLNKVLKVDSGFRITLKLCDDVFVQSGLRFIVTARSDLVVEILLTDFGIGAVNKLAMIVEIEIVAGFV